MTQQKTKALNLRIPGPTPVPPDIPGRRRPADSQPLRGKEFAGIVERIAERLKDFFLTSQDVMVLSCSGTGGLEAAVVNTLSPGDRSSPSASALSGSASRPSPRPTARR